MHTGYFFYVILCKVDYKLTIFNNYMQKVHSRFLDKYLWYKKWHEQKEHSFIHWGIFIIAILFFSSTIVQASNENLTQELKIIKQSTLVIKSTDISSKVQAKNTVQHVKSYKEEKTTDGVVKTLEYIDTSGTCRKISSFTSNNTDVAKHGDFICESYCEGGGLMQGCDPKGKKCTKCSCSSGACSCDQVYLVAGPPSPALDNSNNTVLTNTLKVISYTEKKIKNGIAKNLVYKSPDGKVKNVSTFESNGSNTDNIFGYSCMPLGCNSGPGNNNMCQSPEANGCEVNGITCLPCYCQDSGCSCACKKTSWVGPPTQSD